MPTLIVGERRLTQSLAIIEYLERRHPRRRCCLRRAEDRAWVRALALAIACDIHPIDNSRVLKYLAEVLKVDEPARDAWYRHWIEAGFRAIESQLAHHGGGRYCFGDAPGWPTCSSFTRWPTRGASTWPWSRTRAFAP